jgi:ParB family chromosome partitioning protein
MSETKQNIPGIWDYKNEKWEVLNLPIGDIKGISPFNCRKEVPDVGLDELVTSMRQTGINTMPIILDENNEVIAGQRRYKAALIAKLETLFVIRKPMAENEKLIRSFVENELQVVITQKDRYDFVKQLNSKGMKQEAIAMAVGRTPGCISQWASYNTVPQSIAGTKAEEAYKETTPKKKNLVRGIAETNVMKENVGAATTLAMFGNKMSVTALEELSKDAQSGLLNVNTVEKVNTVINQDKTVQSNPSQYKLKAINFPIETFNDINRVLKIKYPTLVFNDIIIDVMKEWAKTKSKELGLMS